MTDGVHRSPTEPVRSIVHLANSAVAARARHVIADLGVADAIGLDDEVAIEELAGRCGCDADALHRVLRLLEVHGIFRSEQRCWSHIPGSAVLRHDHPLSAKAYVRFLGQPGSWERVTQLAVSVRTGRPPLEFDEPDGPFAALASDAELLAFFQAAMTAKAHADVTDILSAVDFSPYETVADIGGGFGHLLRAITEHHPHIRGILFDLPHVLTQVAPAPRIELHPGDFFVEPLPSTDLSIVMHVIHDWDDVAAATIFSAIAATAKPGAHLMVFEWVLGEQPTEDDANVMDVLMLTGPGGRERTAAEYTALLTRAGFETTAVRRIAGPMHVIEAHKTSS